MLPITAARRCLYADAASMAAAQSSVLHPRVPALDAAWQARVRATERPRRLESRWSRSVTCAPSRSRAPTGSGGGGVALDDNQRAIKAANATSITRAAIQFGRMASFLRAGPAISRDSGQKRFSQIVRGRLSQSRLRDRRSSPALFHFHIHEHRATGKRRPVEHEGSSPMLF